MRTAGTQMAARVSAPVPSLYSSAGFALRELSHEQVVPEAATSQPQSLPQPA